MRVGVLFVDTGPGEPSAKYFRVFRQRLSLALSAAYGIVANLAPDKPRKYHAESSFDESSHHPCAC